MKLIKYYIFLFLFYSNSVLAKFAEPEKINNEIKKESSNSFFTVGSGVDMITLLFSLVFIFSIIGFAFSGLKFITAGGSETSLEQAHKTWTASLTGLIISLVGYIALKIIQTFFF